MATLDEIRSAITTIAESVTNIGNVFAQVPHIKQWDVVFKDLVKDNVLKIFLFTKTERLPKVIVESFASWEKQHKWVCKYIYSSDFEQSSDIAFDNICEAICKKFDASNKLNGKVKRLSPISQTNKGYVMTCGVLCHYAEFEFTTAIN